MSVSVVFGYLYVCIFVYFCVFVFVCFCICVFVAAIKVLRKMQLQGNICRAPPAAAGCIYSNILNLDLSEEFKFNFCLNQTFYNLPSSSSSSLSCLIRLFITSYFYLQFDLYFNLLLYLYFSEEFKFNFPV